MAQTNEVQMADGRSRDRGRSAYRPIAQTRQGTPKRRPNRCTTFRRAFAADLLQMAERLIIYTTVYCTAPQFMGWGRPRNLSFAKLTHTNPYCCSYLEA